MLNINRTFLSPNRSSGWLYGKPNKVVVHSTRSGQTNNWSHDKEMGSTINWFLGTNSSASSNLIISPTEIVRMVPDEFPSWHAKEHSWQAYGIEVTQPTPDTPIEDGQYDLLAKALRHYRTLDVQPVWLPSLTWGDTASGWIQHLETDQGLRDGKSDIGYRLDKTRLLNMVREEPEVDMHLIYFDEAGTKGVYIVGGAGRKRYIDDLTELAYFTQKLGPPELVSLAIVNSIPDEPNTHTH